MNNIIGVGAPVMYDYQNMVNGAYSPSMVHVHDSMTAWYFRKYLFEEFMSIYEWNLPPTWAENYFKYVLYGWGYIAVVETNLYGAIPQGCTLHGQDIFYQPNRAIISNPALKGIKDLKIGVQTEIIKMQPDYSGVMDIINIYADLMALCLETASMNIMNSQLSYVFSAEDKAAAESFKKLFDKIKSGEPAVVIDKSLYGKDGSKKWEAFEQNVGANYIAGDVLEDMRKIKNMFNTEVGIPNANTDKKERMLVDEVNANNEETTSKAAIWLQEMKLGVEKVNKMFGLNLSVDWRRKVENKTEGVEE